MPTTATSPSLAYKIDGTSGSPVLLIMGFSMPGSAWLPQVQDLQAHHRVISFDNRGIGASGTTPAPWSMAELAEDAMRVIDDAGIDQVHLVGVSMGGMIAQHVALNHRSRLKSLALIATHAGGRRGKLAHLGGLIPLVRASVGSDENRLRGLGRLLYPTEFLEEMGPDWVAQRFANLSQARPARATQLAQIGAIMNHRTVPDLKRLAGLRSMVIVPESDRLIRPGACKRLARLLPGSKLVSIPRAGHGVLAQCPSVVNDALLGHFRDADA